MYNNTNNLFCVTPTLQLQIRVPELTTIHESRPRAAGQVALPSDDHQRPRVSNGQDHGPHGGQSPAVGLLLSIYSIAFVISSRIL